MSGLYRGAAQSTRPIVLLAAIGQVLIFAMTAVLANTMSPSAFEAYAVAASLFLLAARLAPVGVEALALRVMGPAHRDGDTRTLGAFAGFAARRASLGCAVVMALAWAGVEIGDPSRTPDAALLAGWLAIPFGVAAHVGFDMMTAVGCARTAAVLLRLFVPGLASLIILGMLAGGVDVTGARAIGAWTAAWAAVVPLQWQALRRALPPRPWSSAPRGQRSHWTRSSLPLFLYQLGSGLLVQAPMLALAAFDVPAADVGAYVAASTCAGVLVIVGAAANRVYARELAILVDRGDAEGVRLLKARRLKRMAPGLTVALAACWVVPEWLLAWFGEAFARDGIGMLRLLALAAVVTLAFALVPTYLNYSGRGARVITATLAAAAFELILLALLVPAMGGVGAALGYTVGVIGLYVALLALSSQPRATR